MTRELSRILSEHSYEYEGVLRLPQAHVPSELQHEADLLFGFPHGDESPDYIVDADDLAEC